MTSIRTTPWMAACVPFFSVLVGPVQADLAFEAVGDPVDAGSWLQGFRLSAVNSFEHVGLVLVPRFGDDGTSSFKNPAWDFSITNPDGFSESLFLPRLTVASGASTNELIWQSHFSGDKESQRFLLALFAWDESLNFQVAAARWDGGSWAFGVPPGITWEAFQAMTDIGGASAPIPPAALLGLIGLGLVDWVRRRDAA